MFSMFLANLYPEYLKSAFQTIRYEWTMEGVGRYVLKPFVLPTIFQVFRDLHMEFNNPTIYHYCDCSSFQSVADYMTNRVCKTPYLPMILAASAVEENPGITNMYSVYDNYTAQFNEFAKMEDSFKGIKKVLIRQHRQLWLHYRDIIRQKSKQ